MKAQPAPKNYCEMCDKWFANGGDCRDCGYPLRKS
jgi:hypothetical protein